MMVYIPITGDCLVWPSSDQVSKRRNVALGLGAPPPGLVAQLDRARILRESELTGLISTFRPEWALAQRTRLDTLVGWMLAHTKLHQFSIHSEIRSSIVRYVWGEASPPEIAASLAPNGYFCHATAASLHGLLTFNPETIYLNREQSAKPVSNGPLSQDGIDRAFSKKQRTSQDVYSWGPHESRCSAASTQVTSRPPSARACAMATQENAPQR
jgi:hypothetical protein